MSLEQAEVLAKADTSRMVYIDFYTDWCGWCKKMDRSTFEDTAVIRLLSTRFIPVKFNAEQREAVQLSKGTFVYRPENKAHEVAIAIMQGKMGYPTSAFLNSRLDIVQLIPGYMPAEKFSSVLAWLSDDHAYQKMSLEDYTAAREKARKSATKSKK